MPFIFLNFLLLTLKKDLSGKLISVYRVNYFVLLHETILSTVEQLNVLSKFILACRPSGSVLVGQGALSLGTSNNKVGS